MSELDIKLREVGMTDAELSDHVHYFWCEDSLDFNKADAPNEMEEFENLQLDAEEQRALDALEEMEECRRYGYV